jgi:hypothetical protein
VQNPPSFFLEKMFSAKVDNQGKAVEERVYLDPSDGMPMFVGPNGPYRPTPEEIYQRQNANYEFHLQRQKMMEKMSKKANPYKSTMAYYESKQLNRTTSENVAGFKWQNPKTKGQEKRSGRALRPRPQSAAPPVLNERNQLLRKQPIPIAIHPARSWGG